MIWKHGLLAFALLTSAACAQPAPPDSARPAAATPSDASSKMTIHLDGAELWSQLLKLDPTTKTNFKAIIAEYDQKRAGVRGNTNFTLEAQTNSINQLKQQTFAKLAQILTSAQMFRFTNHPPRTNAAGQLTNRPPAVTITVDDGPPPGLLSASNAAPALHAPPPANP